nr:hypothetical protein [Tanacetum cinerariifolium]
MAGCCCCCTTRVGVGLDEYGNPDHKPLGKYVAKKTTVPNSRRLSSPEHGLLYICANNDLTSQGRTIADFDAKTFKDQGYFILNLSIIISVKPRADTNKSVPLIPPNTEPPKGRPVPTSKIVTIEEIRVEISESSPLRPYISSLSLAKKLSREVKQTRPKDKSVHPSFSVPDSIFTFPE